MIGSQQKSLDTGYATYLLCCSMNAVYHLSNLYRRGNLPHYLTKSLNLVAELLSRGADPNVYVEDFTTTIWGMFLGRVPGNDFSAEPEFVKLAMIFLENGADVHIKLSNQVSVLPERRDPKKFFRHEWSALHILRRWLKDSPELDTLERIYLAKGGRDFHRYTHFVIATNRPRHNKMTEREHDRLITTLAAERPPQNHLDHVILNVEYFTMSDVQQLEEMCKEILGSNINSDGRVPSDEDVTSDTEAEEELYESVDDQTVADVQRCRLSDARRKDRLMACDGGLRHCF